MKTRYAVEQRVFARLCADCSPAAKAEYEHALAILVQRYNTTIYENRFVVGGAVEVFTCALLKSVGIDCTLYGDQAAGGDILLPGDRKLSVKSRFTLRGHVTLLNKRGQGIRTWQTATLFVLSGVGIVFGAPDMVDHAHLTDTGDAQNISQKGLAALMADTANVLPMEIAQKQPTEMTGFSDKASTALARQILSENEAQTLLRAFPSTG